MFPEKRIRQAPIKNKHGMRYTLSYSSWYQMLSRCYDEKCTSYKYYGARGIKVIDKWHSFLGFFEDMGERKIGMSIDRINTDGNYEPCNCKWSSDKEQANNRRARSVPIKRNSKGKFV